MVGANKKPQPWYSAPKTSYSNKSAIIIGGGLAGTSCAYSLVRRGWEVTLIERGNVAAGAASGNPVGIISPLFSQQNDPIGKLYWAGFKHSLKYLQNLENVASGVGFNQCGILELAKPGRDLDLNIVPESEIIKVTGADASNLCGVELAGNALHIANAGFVSPALVCAANIAACVDKIKVVLSQNILSLIKIDAGWVAVDDTGREVAAAPVCIIANAHDATVFEQTSHIPLHPVRGQLTYLPAMLNLKKILCYEGGYISPEYQGYHYVGATYGRDNISREVRGEDNIENINNLSEILDTGDVDASKLQGRASIRAFVPDRRPVIGAVPDIKAFCEDYADLKHGRNKEYPSGKYLGGLYISTGHGSRGLVSAPIGGEIIASLINNEEFPVTAEIMNILSPARFIIKKLQGR